MYGNEVIGSGGIEMNVNLCLFVYFLLGYVKFKCMK